MNDTLFANDLAELPIANESVDQIEDEIKRLLDKHATSIRSGSIVFINCRRPQNRIHTYVTVCILLISEKSCCCFPGILGSCIQSYRYATGKKVSEYGQEIPQSHTADQPTALRKYGFGGLH